MIEQHEDCPNCRAFKGWWSNVVKPSMVFHEANGEIKERRVYEGTKKYCVECDFDITECIR